MENRTKLGHLSKNWTCERDFTMEIEPVLGPLGAGLAHKCGWAWVPGCKYTANNMAGRGKYMLLLCYCTHRPDSTSKMQWKSITQHY